MFVFIGLKPFFHSDQRWLLVTQHIHLLGNAAEVGQQWISISGNIILLNRKPQLQQDLSFAVSAKRAW